MATAAAAVPAAVTLDGQKVFDVLVGLLKAEKFNDCFGRTVETGGSEFTSVEEFWHEHEETQHALTCAIANLWAAAFGRAYEDDNGTVTPLRGLAETEAQRAYDKWLIREVARMRITVAKLGGNPFPRLTEDECLAAITREVATARGHVDELNERLDALA